MKRIIGTLTIIATLSLCAVAQDRSGYLVAGNRSETQTTQDGGGAMGNGHFNADDGGGALGNGHLTAEDGNEEAEIVVAVWNWFNGIF